MTLQIDVLVLWGAMFVTSVFGCLSVWAWNEWRKQHGRGLSEQEWAQRFEPNRNNAIYNPVPDDADEWAYPIGPNEQEPTYERDN